MAVELGQQVWRRDLLSCSTWQLEVLAKRPGDYVLVIPIRLDTFWERYIGGQLWVRTNLTGSELRCFLDIAQHGGILAKNPEHIWVYLSHRVQVALSAGWSGTNLSLSPLLCPSFFTNTIANQMRDADLGLGSVPIACLEDLVNDCMNVLERRDFERQFGSLAPDGVLYSPWDVEGGYGEFFTRYFGEILSGMVAEVEAAVRREGVERRRVCAAKGGCPIYVPLLRILPNDYCTANGTVPGRADGPFDGQSEDEPTGSEDGHSDDGGDSPRGSGEHRTGKRGEVPSQPGDEGEQGGPGSGNGPHRMTAPTEEEKGRRSS